MAMQEIMLHGQISGAQAQQHLILTLVETLVVVVAVAVAVVRLQQHSFQQLVSQYLIEDVLFVAIHHTSQMFVQTVVLDAFP